MMTSVYHLLALAISHYILTVHPCTYQDKLDKATLPMLIIMWLAPPALFLTLFMVYYDETFGQQEGFCTVNFLNTLTFRWFTLASFILPLAIMCAVYG
jgi:hypothetical protein